MERNRIRLEVLDWSAHWPRCHLDCPGCCPTDQQLVPMRSWSLPTLHLQLGPPMCGNRRLLPCPYRHHHCCSAVQENLEWAPYGACPLLPSHRYLSDCFHRILHHRKRSFPQQILLWGEHFSSFRVAECSEVQEVRTRMRLLRIRRARTVSFLSLSRAF